MRAYAFIRLIRVKNSLAEYTLFRFSPVIFRKLADPPQSPRTPYRPPPEAYPPKPCGPLHCLSASPRRGPPPWRSPAVPAPWADEAPGCRIPARHRHFFTVGRHSLRLPQFFRMDHPPFLHILFQAANGHRTGLDSPNTLTPALALLGAHPPVDGWQVAGRLQNDVSRRQVALSNLLKSSPPRLTLQKVALRTKGACSPPGSFSAPY